MIKKLALILGLLLGFASVCFGNEIRASDFATAFLQTTIMWGIALAIIYMEQIIENSC